MTYLVLRPLCGALFANVLAMALLVGLNTEANRRWTFKGRCEPQARQYLRALVLFAAYTAVTSGVLFVLDRTATLPPIAESAAVVVVSVMLTLARFVAMDRWVFRRADDGQGVFKGEGRGVSRP